MALLLIVILLAMPFTIAQGPGTGGGSKILTDEDGNVFMEFKEESSLCQDFMKQDGVIGFKLPSFVPYKTEVFHIFYQDDEPLGYIELVDGKIVGADCDIQGDPTFVVYVASDEVLLNIVNSQDPLGAFNDAKSEGTLVIKGVGFGKQVKNVFTGIFAKVAHWFT